MQLLLSLQIAAIALTDFFRVPQPDATSQNDSRHLSLGVTHVAGVYTHMLLTNVSVVHALLSLHWPAASAKRARRKTIVLERDEKGKENSAVKKTLAHENNVFAHPKCVKDSERKTARGPPHVLPVSKPIFLNVGFSRL